MHLRGVVSHKPKNDFPYGVLKKYQLVLAVDDGKLRVEGAVESTLVEGSLVNLALQEIAQFFSTTYSKYSHSKSPHTIPEIAPPVLTSSISAAGYTAGVADVLEYIRDGHTYQLNYSIRYTLEDVQLDIPALFYALYEKWPAKFYAYFVTGSYEILSTSPELFLRVNDGHVLTQPIKGTLAFEEYSPELHKQVTDSPKESAELSMIVDLMRNDISSCCKYASVRVENHKSIFVVDKLLQMYSDVHGELRADRDCIDLLWETLPGGSVTGCPKKRSLEVIDTLEPHSRDVYCGSFVVIDGPRDMESSIAIRTGYQDLQEDKFHFFAGSGIVVDSEPEKEYKETVAKAGKFFDIFGVTRSG